MDPISTAIIAAMASGLTQPLVSETYTRLMTYIRTKYEKTDLPATVDRLKKKPDSKALPGLLSEELARTGAGNDEELKQLAAQILKILQSSPEGRKTITMVNCKIGVSAGDHAIFHGDINL